MNDVQERDPRMERTRRGDRVSERKARAVREIERHENVIEAE
jgi:hypothetical protein